MEAIHRQNYERKFTMLHNQDGMSGPWKDGGGANFPYDANTKKTGAKVAGLGRKKVMRGTPSLPLGGYRSQISSCVLTHIIGCAGIEMKEKFQKKTKKPIKSCFAFFWKLCVGVTLVCSASFLQDKALHVNQPCYPMPRRMWAGRCPVDVDVGQVGQIRGEPVVPATGGEGHTTDHSDSRHSFEGKMARWVRASPPDSGGWGREINHFYPSLFISCRQRSNTLAIAGR